LARSLFGPLAGNDLAEGRILEDALAFAEPATMRVYPGRIRNDPPCIVSVRIIQVSCHSSLITTFTESIVQYPLFFVGES
jgi:hypothetical protein